MEEILASIRRIIAEDDKPATPVESLSPPARNAGRDTDETLAHDADGPRETATITPLHPNAGPAGSDDAPAATSALDVGSHTVPADEIEALLAALDEPRAPASDEPILELTEIVEPKPVAGFQRVGIEDEVSFADEAEAFQPAPLRPAESKPFVEFPMPAFAPPPPQPAPAPAAFSGADALLSNQANAAVQSAFQSLASTILTQNARTLEDLVQDMLRPMLKSWLDDNLPGLVERLVRAEIERVSRGPR